MASTLEPRADDGSVGPWQLLVWVTEQTFPVLKGLDPGRKVEREKPARREDCP